MSFPRKIVVLPIRRWHVPWQPFTMEMKRGFTHKIIESRKQKDQPYCSILKEGCEVVLHVGGNICISNGVELGQFTVLLESLVYGEVPFD